MNHKQKIIFFPKYTYKGASSRYRIYNYLPMFKKYGYCYEVFPLLDDTYIDSINTNKHYNKIKLFILYIRRFFKILKISSNDIIYIQYELLPFFPSILEWYIKKIKKAKYLLDFDDAIFLNYLNSKNLIIRLLFAKKIPKIIKLSDYIITGSPFLTSYAKKYNSNVIEIPTSVDFNKYQIVKKEINFNNSFIIGWIGSKTTSINLLEIIPIILSLSKNIDLELWLIGFDKNLENRLTGINYKLIEWTEESEIKNILQFDVGIMPLLNMPFNMGKCGFKLIQYMACGIPTISSPFEANIKINRNNGNLFANSSCEWEASLKEIYLNKKLFEEIGKKNIEIVKQFYTTQANFPIYQNIINSLVHINTD